MPINIDQPPVCQPTSSVSQRHFGPNAPRRSHVLLSVLMITFLLTIPFMHVPQVAYSATTVTVCSVTTSRGNLAPGDAGYTLDGAFMTAARAKLLDPANFGPAGTVQREIELIDGFGTADSITATSLEPCSIFFMGSFANNVFTAAERDALYTWSLQPGKFVILTGQAPIGVAVVERWGYTLAVGNNNPTTPTSTGATHPAFDGPFGVVTTVNQGGTAQGYFSTTTGSTVLAENAAGNPTVLLDGATADLIIADTDYFTSLGSISAGSGISTSADLFWANLFATPTSAGDTRVRLYLPLITR